MTRKSIQTNGPVISCDVCGRTLLRGERADVFLHGGTRHMVCELCTGRAVHEGWIREGLDDAIARSRHDTRRRGSFLQRLRALRPDPAPNPQPDPPQAPEHKWPDDAPGRDVEVQPGPEPEWVPAPAMRQVPVAAREPQPMPAREPRSVHAVPTNADLKMARALDLFNASPHRRTVSGVARSLGAPVVSVRPSATEGSVVTIVVAWELSWYRYEVDLGDEAAGVRVVAQGAELEELESAEQEPNAAADEDGALHLAARHA